MKRFSVKMMVLAAVLMAPVAGRAQTVGTLTIDGVKESGGSIRYQFKVTAYIPTTLRVTGKLTGTGLSYTFPDMTKAISGGTTTISGPYYTLPGTYTGTVTMAVNVYSGIYKIASKTATATITKPYSTVSTSLYDVGFENLITLNGKLVSTTGMGAVTYTWKQTSGKTVALSATNVAMPTFTTPAVTNFITMRLFNAYTNQPYATPEHRFGTNGATAVTGGLAMDYEQATAATYGFRVLVSNGSVTRTGLFTVASASATPAHPNIPVGVMARYKGTTNSVNWSLLVKPAGSLATLMHTNGLIPELRPDLAGVYVIKDNVTGKIVTNTAANWTGVDFCNNCHGPGNSFGLADMVSPWSKTGHAGFFQKAIDGEEGSYYKESCIRCHTVGYNNAPLAANFGFDDVASSTGWKFPSVIQAGNYAAMPTDLQNKSGIQCENCHGPGSKHPGSGSISMDVKVCSQCHQDGSHHVRPEQWEISPHAGGFESVSYSGTPKRGENPQCSRCHSPVGFRDVATGAANVGTTNSVTTTAGPLTCQACHDPHDAFDNDERHQLRVYDTALLGNPYYRSNTVSIAVGETITTADPRLTNSNLIVTGLGNAATCVTCHNGRQLPTQVQLYGTTAGKMFYQTGGPHDQLAGEAFLGVGMYDYGQIMGNSFHTYMAECQTCHMYQLRAPASGVPQDAVSINDVVTPVTASVWTNLVNVIGNHTFKVNYAYTTNSTQYEVQNVAACNQCHDGFEPVESFDFKSAIHQDYDGNGVVEGIQTQTKNLMRNLGILIAFGTNGVPPNGTIYTNTAVYASTNATMTGIWMPLATKRTIVSGVTNYYTTVDTGKGSYVTGFGTATNYYGFNNPNNTKVIEAQRKAVWNWLACYREGSFGVHNSQYTIRLLQTTYTDLSTNVLNDASKTFLNTFPLAFPR